MRENPDWSCQFDSDKVWVALELAMRNVQNPEGWEIPENLKTLD